MPAKQARNYCFTWNNYTDEDIKRIEDSAKCTWFQYCIYGKEICPSTGTPHLQGYLQLKTKKSITAMKKAYGNTPHWEVARGSLEDNEYYCQKDKDYTELGQKKKSASQRGSEPWEAIRKMIADGEDYDIMYDTIADAYPSMAGRYMHAIKTWINEAKDAAILKLNKEQFENAVLREWQKACVEALENQNQRELIWVYDEDGNTGKTFLAKWLHFVKGAFYFENAKKADIACAWNLEEFAVCNLTRDKEGLVQYSVFESLKDGMVFSGKYESKTKVAPKQVKLVIMSNWLPDISTMSIDRWQILQLNGDEFSWWTATDIKNLKAVQSQQYDCEKDMKRKVDELSAHTRTLKRKLTFAPFQLDPDGPPKKKARLERKDCLLCQGNNCNIH